MHDDAFEIYGDGRMGPMVITCEHASNTVLAPLETSAADRAWLETHWGYDIGAATVARRLVERSGSMAVLARFSRLVCDPNRDVGDPTWIRTEVEAHALSFNAGLDDAERERRRTTYYDPYHGAIDRLLADRTRRRGDVLLVSVHSFTPVFADEDRSMEIGVLFDRFAPIADRFAAELRREGFATALNAPYSGMDGMAFAVQRHGTAHNVVYLEVELRQDLIGDEASAMAVGDRLANALARLSVRARSRG